MKRLALLATLAWVGPPAAASIWLELRDDGAPATGLHAYTIVAKASNGDFCNSLALGVSGDLYQVWPDQTTATPLLHPLIPDDPRDSKILVSYYGILVIRGPWEEPLESTNPGFNHYLGGAEYDHAGNVIPGSEYQMAAFGWFDETYDEREMARIVIADGSTALIRAGVSGRANGVGIERWYDFAPTAQPDGPYSIEPGQSLTLGFNLGGAADPFAPDAAWGPQPDDDAAPGLGGSDAPSGSPDKAVSLGGALPGGQDFFLNFAWSLDGLPGFETDAGDQPVITVDYAYLETLGLEPGKTYEIRGSALDSFHYRRYYTTTLTIVPEPCTWMLLALALPAVRRRRG